MANKPLLFVLIALMLSLPFLTISSLILSSRVSRKYANPPPPDLPATYRSDRALIVFPFLLCCGGLGFGGFLTVIALSTEGAGGDKLTIGLMSLTLLVPSACFFWRLGYRLLFPDRLTLSSDGICHFSLGRTLEWGWQEVIDADFEHNVGTNGAIPPALILVLRSGELTLGNLWKSPFETMGAAMLAKAIRSTIVARGGRVDDRPPLPKPAAAKANAV